MKHLHKFVPFNFFEQKIFQYFYYQIKLKFSNWNKNLKKNRNTKIVFASTNARPKNISVFKNAVKKLGKYRYSFVANE